MESSIEGSGASPNPSSLLDFSTISRDGRPYRSNYKLVISGKIVEVYKFEYSLKLNQPKPEPRELTYTEIMDALLGIEEVKTKPSPETDLIDKVLARVREQRRVSRAKNTMRRLIQTNFDASGKFLTLTFKNTHAFDITSLAECNKRRTYFYHNLRAQYPDCKFVAVPEYQKRGAVHYHLILNLPYIPIEEIRKMWPYGFVKINKIHNPSKVGWYVAKYLAKNVADPRFKHHRCYSSSLNLDKPTVLYGNELEEELEKLHSAGYKPNYQTTYYTKWCGRTTYSSYNLYQQPAQKVDHE